MRRDSRHLRGRVHRQTRIGVQREQIARVTQSLGIAGQPQKTAVLAADLAYELTDRAALALMAGETALGGRVNAWTHGKKKAPAVPVVQRVNHALHSLDVRRVLRPFGRAGIFEIGQQAYLYILLSVRQIQFFETLAQTLRFRSGRQKRRNRQERLHLLRNFPKLHARQTHRRHTAYRQAHDDTGRTAPQRQKRRNRQHSVSQKNTGRRTGDQRYERFEQ